MPKILDEKDFVLTIVESTSLNGGILATKDGDTFIFKPAPLVPSGVASKGQRKDLVAEYLSAPIFNELLGDRAPEIGLVSGSDKKTVYLSSKFFKDFQTLSELSPIKQEKDPTKDDPTRCNPDGSKLKKVSGFEKVIAACLAAGEIDIHAGNIGVVKQADGYEAVKIDHGRSGIEKFDDESELRGILADKFAEIGYGSLNFDVSKFKAEVSRACSLEDSVVKALVKSRIDTLKKAGLEASSISAHGEKDTFGVKFDPATKPKPKAPPKRTFKSSTATPEAAPEETVPMEPKEKARIEAGAYEEIRIFYVGGFSARKKVLKELEKTLSIVEKIDMPPEWKKGAWLQDIKGQDPIEWAKENGKTIEGKPASVWLSDRTIAARTIAASKIQNAFRAHSAKRLEKTKMPHIALKEKTAIAR